MVHHVGIAILVHVQARLLHLAVLTERRVRASGLEDALHLRACLATVHRRLAHAVVGETERQKMDLPLRLVDLLDDVRRDPVLGREVVFHRHAADL